MEAGERRFDFWMSPRELGRMLQAGELTTTEFALLQLLGSLGADTRGVPSSYVELASYMDVSSRTIERAFKRFKADDAVRTTKGLGRRGAFRVTFGAALYVRPPTQRATSDLHLVSDFNLDTNPDTDVAAVVPIPTERNGFDLDANSDTVPDASRVRGEETKTETDIKKVLSVARYAGEVPEHLVEYAERCRRELLATADATTEESLRKRLSEVAVEEFGFGVVSAYLDLVNDQLVSEWKQLKGAAA